MKVITELPIVVGNKVVSKGAWSHFDDDKFSYVVTPPKTVKDYVAKQPTQKEKDEKKKKGLTWDAAKGKWTNANEAVGMLAQTIGGIKGLFGKQEPAYAGAPAPEMEKTAEKKSNTPLIVGGIVVALVIVVAVVVAKRKGK